MSYGFLLDEIKWARLLQVENSNGVIILNLKMHYLFNIGPKLFSDDEYSNAHDLRSPRRYIINNSVRGRDRDGLQLRQFGS